MPLAPFAEGAVSLPYHPLANLFPLIEGSEFDELVASIKANGQRRAVVTLDGMILDGRNRYRACLAAGVLPIIEPFTGSNPIAFVVDENVHRRHLNESQRGLIAAQLATLKQGRPTAKTNVEISTFIPTQDEAAVLMNVSRATVTNAKKVLEEGTAAEIAAVKSGELGVGTVAKEIRRKVPSEDRKLQRGSSLSSVGKNPERIQTQRINAHVWAQVRDAVSALTSLPLPSDVVAIVRAHDKAGFVDARVKQSVQWLKEFADAWGDRDQTAA